MSGSENNTSCAQIHCRIAMARINARPNQKLLAKALEIAARSGNQIAAARLNKLTGPALESCISGKVYDV